VTGAGASMGRWPVTGQSRSSLQDTGAPPGAEIVRVAARRRLEGCPRRSSLEHTRGWRPRRRACPGGLPPSGPGRLIVDAHRAGGPAIVESGGPVHALGEGACNGKGLRLERERVVALRGVVLRWLAHEGAARGPLLSRPGCRKLEGGGGRAEVGGEVEVSVGEVPRALGEGIAGARGCGAKMMGIGSRVVSATSSPKRDAHGGRGGRWAPAGGPGGSCTSPAAAKRARRAETRAADIGIHTNAYRATAILLELLRHKHVGIPRFGSGRGSEGRNLATPKLRRHWHATAQLDSKREEVCPLPSRPGGLLHVVTPAPLDCFPSPTPASLA